MNIMKRIPYLIVIAILIAVFFTVLPTRAQEYGSEYENYIDFGLFFGFKGGVNGNYIPLGRKNAFAFHAVPDFGARVFVPLNETADLGMSFDLSYSNYMYGVKNFYTEEYYAHKYAYIAISPMFHFFEAFFGFNFGYPVNADFGEKINTDHLNLLAEFRMGAEITVLGDEKGKVNIFAIAGYSLTGLYTDFSKHDPLLEIIPPEEKQTITNKFNPRPLTLLIGVSYMFTIGL